VRYGGLDLDAVSSFRLCTTRQRKWSRTAGRCRRLRDRPSSAIAPS